MVNVSSFQDKYEELPPGQTIYNTFFHVGDRVDKFYTSTFVKTTDGQIINDDAGKPLSNPVDRYVGHLNADYQWSVYNKVNWKGLSVGFQFDGSVGGVTTDYMRNKTMRGAATWKPYRENWVLRGRPTVTTSAIRISRNLCRRGRSCFKWCAHQFRFKNRGNIKL
jgi:hypothetical protein